MRHISLVLIILLVFANSEAVIRFKKEQIQFELIESDGTRTTCMHEPYTHKSPATPPPWWTVKCESRTYTTDVWMDLLPLKEGYRFQLMYHAKESTSSSGEKLTRFDSHLTSFELRSKELPSQLTSWMDIRNGLADLRVVVKLD